MEAEQWVGLSRDQEWKAGLREEVLKAKLGKGQRKQEGGLERHS